MKAGSSLRFGMTTFFLFSATCETVHLRHYQRSHTGSLAHGMRGQQQPSP
jgi:hypothetical protein